MIHHYIQRTIKWCTIICYAPFNGAPWYSTLRGEVIVLVLVMIIGVPNFTVESWFEASMPSAPCCSIAWCTIQRTV